MADGGLTLHLNTDLADRLRRAAEAAGDDVESYAARALDYVIGPGREWSVDEAIADETIRKGDGIPLETFVARLDDFGRSRD